MSTDRPTLVYDDDCGFCTWSAEWVANRAPVDIVGFSELTDAQIDRLPDDWRDCAHLLADEAVYSCGAAMEQAFLLTNDDGTRLVRAAREAPGYENARERAYRFVADHRSWFGRFTP
ncbi:MAG: DCC1-like thiol-disulfide oxidoreductase family protein [Halobacteriales archaeon]